VTSLSTPAIVLRAINYGESDRVVTLIGRATGRLSALARGARKSQKRFGGGLGLCAVGDAGLRERHGAELLTLERFDLRESHASFATDIARMAHAAYVAELVSKLCAPRQVELEVYDWLLAFLGALDRHGASAERLRVFELGLLARLGFGPMLETCAVCGGAVLRAHLRVAGDAGSDGGDASNVLGVPALCAQPGRIGSTTIHATTARAKAALPSAAMDRAPIETLRVHPRRISTARSTATRHATFSAAAHRYLVSLPVPSE